MSEPPSFGQWLREHRKAKDLTQDQLAYEVNLSPEMIRKIESGTRIPSRETADMLAKYFEVPPPDNYRSSRAF